MKDELTPEQRIAKAITTNWYRLSCYDNPEQAANAIHNVAYEISRSLFGATRGNVDRSSMQLADALLRFEDQRLAEVMDDMGLSLEERCDPELRSAIRASARYVLGEDGLAEVNRRVGAILDNVTTEPKPHER